LHSLDIEREGLPRSFAAKLARAFGHYGVSDLERSPAVLEAAFRLFLAHQRAADHIPVVTAVLDRLDELSGRTETLPDQLRPALDRLVVATQLRFPAVGQLARAVRYRSFDKPLLARRREAAYEEVTEIAARLDEQPDRPDRDALMTALITCPYPLLGSVVERLEDVSLRSFAGTTSSAISATSVPPSRTDCSSSRPNTAIRTIRSW